MKMAKNLSYFLLVCVFLIGCFKPDSVADISISPKSTSELDDVGVQELSTSFVTPILTITPSDTDLLSSNTPVNTISPTSLILNTDTPLPISFHFVNPITIVSPGPMSMVVSPINFVVHIEPNYTGTTQIDLVGEDGTELYRRLFKSYPNVGYYTRLVESIDFEIRNVAELARLQVSTYDIMGRLQAVNSTTILLQTVGENKFTPARIDQSILSVDYPKYGEEINGNSLIVKGTIRPLNSMPVIFELQNIKGKIIFSRIVQVDNKGADPTPFILELPFDVTEKTDVRLIIRQSDDKLDGLYYLYSMPLFLSP